VAESGEDGMSKPKTRTEQAMIHRREAYTERLCKSPPVLAPLFDRLADELLVLPGPPDVGAGGEVIREQAPVQTFKRRNIRDTLQQGPSQIAEEASIRRTDLLMQPSFDCVALAVDTAESIGAANGLEKILAHQLAVAHEASLRLMDRALSYEAGGRSMREGDSIEACRLANSAARLMSCFQDGIAALQRLRTGGTQTVTVQHVNVASGGQAVVGNVQTQGPRRQGGKSQNG
jgi:hypothetical protein